MAKAALVRLSARKLASDGVGFYPASFVVEVARVVIQQADQPDLVLDLSDADGLAGEHGGALDFAFADADAAASGPPDGVILIRVLGLTRPALQGCGLHLHPCPRRCLC